MKAALHISKPCYENWNSMTPEEKGRHCAVCSKVVVDFTEMPTEKVIEYVSSRSDENICGRFREEQVTLPGVNVPKYSYLGRMRVFLAALILTFGTTLFSSCRHRIGKVQPQGDVRVYDWKEPGIKSQNVIDSPVRNNETHPKGHVNVHPQGTVINTASDTTPQDPPKPMMGKVVAPK